MKYFSQDLIKGARRDSYARWQFIDAVFTGDISIKLALEYLKEAVRDYRICINSRASFYYIDNAKDDIALIKDAIRKATK